ncbi:MAG TPA: YdcF family protein [Candidatus Acidoferrales bacterium]|jgi:uncharacterized SAM-binding protein YcdF (DUF218 family)|nr:YdcF family protein [Candidatus Acidoferrales bacterium]
MIFATILPNGEARKPRVWLSIIGSLLFLLLLVFLNLGRWLDNEDPPQKAAAIAVLSGRMPSRALEAARLYNQGYAPQVWLSYSVEPGAALEKFSVPYAGEEFYDRLLLLHQGVPDSAIHILTPPIVNTADEIRTFGQALRKENLHRIIIVTSKFHTRRTAVLWKRLSANAGEAIIRGSSDDGDDPAHWWRSTGDALDVVREVLGLLNAWAGLPLQPAKS